MIHKVLTVLSASVAMTCAIGLGLILSQRPADLPPGAKLDFSNTLAAAGQVPAPFSSVAMCGGFALKLCRHPSVAQNRSLAVLDGPLGDTAKTAYSYRINTGFAPRGAYRDDVPTLSPSLLIAGAQDEAFHAGRYQATLTQTTDRGTYLIADEVGLLDMGNAPETLRAMKDPIHEL